MSIFGWSYPAGAENDPNAPYNQQEGPCGVCGQDIYGDCICPECPVCGATGDPLCYDGIELSLLSGEPSHGLVRSFAQVALRAHLDQFIEEDAKRDTQLYEELERDQKLAEEYWKSEGRIT